MPLTGLSGLAVLAKAGCNNTACHGSPAGKGGLKLSLFGYEPDLDHVALTKGGKYVNAKEPAKSLVIQKATMQVPHGGGQRFKAPYGSSPLPGGFRQGRP